MSEKIKVAVLVSGGGTNLQALIDKEADGQIPDAHIVKVIASREDAFALERAAKAGIETAVAKEPQQVMEELQKSGADMIVLAGYMKVLPKEIIERYRNKIINIHPSLIPKYCGKGFYGQTGAQSCPGRRRKRKRSDRPFRGRGRRHRGDHFAGKSACA